MNSNAIITLALLAVSMILGFAAVLIGFFIGNASGWERWAASLAVMGLGLTVGVFSLRRLMAINRAVQQNALKKVLESPGAILAQWKDAESGKRILLAQEEIFIGDAHHPCNAFYEKLRRASLQALDQQTVLLMTFVVYPNNIERSFAFKVPDEARQDAERALAHYRQAYLAK